MNPTDPRKTPRLPELIEVIGALLVVIAVAGLAGPLWGVLLLGVLLVVKANAPT